MAFGERHLWPPCSPDCNLLDFFVWGVIERGVDKVPHHKTDSLKAPIVEALANLNKGSLIRVCGSFRARLERIMDSKGDHIE